MRSVRHIEIGTSSLSALILGMSLVLYGLAIALYPRWLSWVAVPFGIKNAARTSCSGPNKIPKPAVTRISLASSFKN